MTHYPIEKIPIAEESTASTSDRTHYVHDKAPILRPAVTKLRNNHD